MVKTRNDVRPSLLHLLLGLIFLYVLLTSIDLMGSAFKSLGTDVAEKIITATAIPFAGLLISILATALVQSSSVTTSLTVGLVSAGAISVQNAIPIVTGANVATPVTAPLAPPAGNPSGLVVAFVHLLFNVFGITIVYPVRPARRIPLRLATFVANKVAKKRCFARVWVGGPFFPMPLLFLWLAGGFS